MDLKPFEFRTQPWFSPSLLEHPTQKGFKRFIPIKTVLIHCFDPRAAEVPHVVAEHFGDEVYPGEEVLDPAGNRIGSSRTMVAVANAGGRAFSALHSIATMEYLFHVERIVVVHHSFCGTTALTPDALIDGFHDHQHADISTLFDHDSLAIMDFEQSLKHDVALLRASPAVPGHVKIYGFFYEINSRKLIEVAQDLPA